MPRIGTCVTTSPEHRLAQRAGEQERDVRRDSIAGTGAGRAERSGQLEREPPAHTQGRHGDPFGRHRVPERLCQHLGQHTCERLHATGAEKVEHK